MGRVLFVTFGGGRLGWRRAALRIARQAGAFDLFDEVQAVGARDLRRFADFWERHGAFIRAHRRGYGYWLWKPFLIMQTLERMDAGDILFYADAGLELNVYGRERMQYYLDLCADRGSLFFGLGGSVRAWAKMDAIARIDRQRRCAQKPLRNASAFFLTKNDAALGLARRWYGLCAEDGYRYLDDSVSRLPNHRDFREHRHDQAILSLLLHQGGFDCVLDGSEIWFGPHSVRGGSEGGRSPVWSSRNASGVPTLALLRLSRARDPNRYSAPVWAWMFCLRRLATCVGLLRYTVGRMLRRRGI